MCARLGPLGGGLEATVEGVRRGEVEEKYRDYGAYGVFERGSV